MHAAIVQSGKLSRPSRRFGVVVSIEEPEVTPMKGCVIDFAKWRHPVLAVLMFSAVVMPSHPSIAQELFEIVRDEDLSAVKRGLETTVWSEGDLGKALIAAAGLNKHLVAKELISAGADSNYSIFGSSTVTVAARKGSSRTLKWLLRGHSLPDLRGPIPMVSSLETRCPGGP